VRAGHDLDRLRLRAVRRDRAQLVSVGADHVGQHVRITGIAPSPRHRVPLPVACRLQRIHGEHLIARCHQRGHPQAPVSLDPDLDLRLLITGAGVLTDQRMQPGHPRSALTEPGPRQRPAGLVHQLDIMMILSPVIPTSTTVISVSPMLVASGSQRENHQRPHE
jgi:hypothetical protein